MITMNGKPLKLKTPRYRRTKANIERAERIDRVLLAYSEEVGELPDESNFADMLCDMMHYARQNKLKFSAELERGRNHYEAEGEEQ